MRVPVDLSLLRDAFLQLAQTPYFDPRLNSVAEDIVGAIDAAAGQTPALDENALRTLARALWAAHKYLAGSTISESPYEIEYSLRTALADWVKDECVFATTLTTDLDFHFWNLDIGQAIDTIVPSYTRKASARLIPIALPRLYKNRPLYCTPLYHELGHFIDNRFSITDMTMLRFPAAGHPEVERNHRAEYFADLFAAQYVGSVAIRTLEQVAQGNPASYTHPATTDRVARMQTFLTNSADVMVDQFRAVLTQLGLPDLALRHSRPTLADAFDDIRPSQISGGAELHGLFPVVWDYLDQVHAGANQAWANRGRVFPDVDRVINDLLEKSIRNHSIAEAWSAATHKV